MSRPLEIYVVKGRYPEASSNSYPAPVAWLWRNGETEVSSTYYEMESQGESRNPTALMKKVFDDVVAIAFRTGPAIFFCSTSGLADLARELVASADDVDVFESAADADCRLAVGSAVNLCFRAQQDSALEGESDAALVEAFRQAQRSMNDRLGRYDPAAALRFEVKSTSPVHEWLDEWLGERSVPVTAILGQTGSGKSSLGTKILDTEDVSFPASGRGRTSTATIRCRNAAEGVWIARAVFRSADDVLRVAENLCVSLALTQPPAKPRRDGLSFDGFSSPEQVVRFERVLGSLGSLGRLPRAMDEGARLARVAAVKSFDLVLRLLREDVERRLGLSSDDVVEAERIVRGSALLQALTGIVLEEAAANITNIAHGDLSRDADGTLAWTYVTPHREAFFDAIRLFYSPSARLFGISVEPLVDVLSVVGPFRADMPSFEIVDTQGVGHDVGEETTLFPARLRSVVNESDRVLCVADAMLGLDPKTADILAQVISSGNGWKVMPPAFTKFDLLRDAARPTLSSRMQHVRGDYRRRLESIGEKVGREAVRSIAARTVEHVLFFGFAEDEEEGDLFRDFLDILLRQLVQPVDERPVVGVPEYDDQALGEALDAASVIASESALGVLERAHWNSTKWSSIRIAAHLARRDPLEGLPASELPTAPFAGSVGRSFQDAMSPFYDTPVRWEVAPASAADRERALSRSRSVNVELGYMAVACQAFLAQSAAWHAAGSVRNTGSTRIRREILQKILAFPSVTVEDLALHRQGDGVDVASRRSDDKLEEAS